MVPYENTLYTLLRDQLKGKYFQSITAPHLIAHFPEENKLNIHLIEDRALSAWFPIEEDWRNIPLGDFIDYAEITEEQFNKYKEEKTDFSNVILAHKESKFIKEYNKPNLSEQKE